MSRTFSIAPTGFDPDEGNNRRWTKWDGSFAPGPQDGFWNLIFKPLRFDGSGATHGDDREARQRRKRTPTDWQVDQEGSHRQRSTSRERNRDRARATDQSAACQYLPAFHPRPMVRGGGESPAEGGSLRDSFCR